MPTPVSQTTKNAPLPPGPRLAPLQTALYVRDPYRYTRRLRQRYGDIVGMPAMNGLIVLAMTSEGARKILSTPMEKFGEAFGADVLTPVLGEGSLLLLAGERHRTERQLLSPTFHGNRMRALSDVIEAVTLERMEQWKPGTELRLFDEMQSISLDVIIRAVLGIEEPERRAIFRTAIRRVIQDANPAIFFFKAAQHRFGGLGPWARFLRHRDELDALMNEEIHKARQSSGEDHPHILARLAQSSREDGQPFSDVSIRDHLLTLLVAGHETTSSALSWAFYELSINPDVCDWLLGEIQADVSEPKSLIRNAALDATSRESLRLHPILAEFFRPVRESMLFGGFTIPAGATLAASILEIHQDPSLYPEPAIFRPQRFIERRFAPHEFAAFGGGHRHCLGSAFALAEMKIVLGTLLPRLRFEPASASPPGTKLRNVTLTPSDGIPVIVRNR